MNNSSIETLRLPLPFDTSCRLSNVGSLAAPVRFCSAQPSEARHKALDHIIT